MPAKRGDVDTNYTLAITNQKSVSNLITKRSQLLYHFVCWHNKCVERYLLANLITIFINPEECSLLIQQKYVIFTMCQYNTMCYFNIIFFAVYIMQAQYFMEDIHLGLLDCQWNISCKLFSYSTDPPL